MICIGIEDAALCLTEVCQDLSTGIQEIKIYE